MHRQRQHDLDPVSSFSRQRVAPAAIDLRVLAAMPFDDPLDIGQPYARAFELGRTVQTLEDTKELVGMPWVDRQLTADDRGAGIETIIEDFQQVHSILRGQRIELKTKGESLRESLPLNGPLPDTKRRS